MPKARLHLLTSLDVHNAQFREKDYLMSDGGGLYLFVRCYGKKEWLLRYTSPLTLARRKQSLGSYPDVSLKQVRTLAQERREMLDKGLDPINEVEKRQATELKIYAEQNEKRRNNVKAVFDDWKRHDLQNRKDKGEEAERAFEKDVFPLIGNKPISEITRQDIKAILDRPVKRGSKRMANRLLSDLRQFFGYADDEELIIQDPTRRFRKDRVGGKEKSRERVLSKEELKELVERLPTSGIARNYQAGIWLILATCCRSQEVTGNQWSNINVTKRNMVIPREMAKNKDEHNVYLSDFALKQITILKSFKIDNWLLPNRTGTGAIERQTLCKQVTDRQSLKKIKGRTQKNNNLALLGGRWTIHDLRRTAATIMQEQGILPHVIKRCQNQKTNDKMAEIYQRARLEKEQQEAFEKLGEYLSVLL